MKTLNRLRIALLASIPSVALATAASAANFNIPAESLETALDAYSAQTGIPVMVANQEIKGIRTRGVSGNLSNDAALARILTGTGFRPMRDPSGSVGIAHTNQHSEMVRPVEMADAAPVHAAAAIESVVVTSSKIKGDIQTVPIAITALSQEQLTSRQIAGGPDLVKEVPNLTFSKTNFTGYNIQIRGIGTQAISVSTDPAVAVALNDIPFIRNHFFEQEFYDVNQVEVLRGPQGTLYGRNATAGVVNVITAKPTDQFEAMASADIGNYHNRRFEGMINVPVVDDRLDIRAAGEWTKRDGYSFNEITGKPVDGRDLWSARVTLGWKPAEALQTYLVWEHFQENDDRLRTGKQLCKTAPIPDSVNGIPIENNGNTFSPGDYLSQGCLPVSLYDKGDPSHGDYGAFGVPNGFSLPYYTGLTADDADVRSGFDPYAETKQSTSLRVIQSSIPSRYRAKNDVVEFNADYKVSPSLTLSSQTGFNSDFLWSTEDYNRFNTAPGIFVDFYLADAAGIVKPDPAAGKNGVPADSAIFCDPQLGCSDRLIVQDLSDEHAWQFSQELRLASNFTGPLNFSVGGNYLHYETEENYYVFINTITNFIANNARDWSGYGAYGTNNAPCLPGMRYPNPNVPASALDGCNYIDPNPIPSVNGAGHNYFLSQNPYVLNSYAAFGEAYYDITPELKLTGGLRWTDDQKHFIELPSELLLQYWGYPSAGTVDQQWNQITGRTALNWSPKLEFTDQTLVYGSFAHGYKAGGANPPGAIYPTAVNNGQLVLTPIHPLTFKPEFIDAYELGTKNTMLDGALTLNGDVFYYDYKDYQISRIVDRTAINDNFNATVRGAELETSWEPAPGLKFSFAGGYENATLNKGDHSVDLMDRTAGNPDWMVVKPFVTTASNCIFPTYVVAALINNSGSHGLPYACGLAYASDLDPVTGLPYQESPTATASSGYVIPPGYPGFDPLSVDPSAPADVNNGLGLPPNGGAGFDKNLSGNQLPNAPHFTLSFMAEYTIPVSQDWAATLHGDFYWQSQSWARVFNDRPYDKLRGYSNVNLALILTSGDGWQVLGYLKNVFNTTAITGDFLNSDDTGLTTNVFLTDPRLFGVRVTKNW